MSRKAELMGGVSERGLGMEIRHYREKAGLTLGKVGSVLGWSANTMSRLERGLRPDTTTEQVSAILAAIDVTGEDRDRLMRMAIGYSQQGWWEDNTTNLTDQARTYLALENRASRIVNVEPLLVPGLLQTPDYCRALLTAFGIEDRQITGRIARRLGRQELLTRPNAPEMVFIVSELSLRQPLGGHTTMSRQLRYMIEQAERPHVSIRVVPTHVVAHPGLHGAFAMLEFADEPSVVHIEGRGSGIFPETPGEVQAYRLAVEGVMDLALDEQKSLELLRNIAEDLERARLQHDGPHRVA